jgi:hypothetical protein
MATTLFGTVTSTTAIYTAAQADAQFATLSGSLSNVLLSAFIFVGSAGNIATGVALSGDATITNAGVLTVANLAITNAKIANATINLATKVTGVLPEANGGTNQSTYATGDTLYASAANTLSKITIGTAGQTYTPVGGIPTWVTNGNAQSTPADPATTVSLVGVMMGLAGSVTPTKSGTVLIVISGDMDNGTANNGAQVQIRTGTGVAPVNGAALTGTTGGGLVKMTITSGGTGTTSRVPFSLNCLITGLAVGTAVWIDVGLASLVGGTSRIRDISISAIEI